MYNMVTIIISTLMYNWNAESINLSITFQKNKKYLLNDTMNKEVVIYLAPPSFPPNTNLLCNLQGAKGSLSYSLLYSQFLIVLSICSEVKVAQSCLMCLFWLIQEWLYQSILPLAENDSFY